MEDEVAENGPLRHTTGVSGSDPQPDVEVAMASPRDFDHVCRFIVTVGESAHKYGTGSLRLEHDLQRLTNKLGYSGVFYCTPSFLSFSFRQDEGGLQRTYVSRTPTGLHLQRLSSVDRIIDDVVALKIELDAAAAKLQAIDDNIQSPFNDWLVGLAYPCAGAGLAILNELAVWDTVFSALFSLVVYAMVWLDSRYGNQRTAVWLPLSTAFVAGGLTACTKLGIKELNLVMVTLNAILILVPGYPISVGVVEIVYNHVGSGMENLFGGLVYLVKQFGGAWLGVAFVGIFRDLPQDPTGGAIDSHWLWLGVPMLIASLDIAFQVPYRDCFWASFVMAAAYGFLRLGSYILGGNLGNLFGTVVTVVIANLWAKITRRPTSIVLLPAIVLLVSGSIGFRGLAAFAEGQTDVGTGDFLQMFVVALTIAGGLVVGNSIVAPV